MPEADNLSNARTVGFKSYIPTVRQRDPESIEGRHGFQVRQDLLDRLGGGVFEGRSWSSTSMARSAKPAMPLMLSWRSVTTSSLSAWKTRVVVNS